MKCLSNCDTHTSTHAHLHTHRRPPAELSVCKLSLKVVWGQNFPCGERKLVIVYGECVAQIMPAKSGVAGAWEQGAGARWKLPLLHLLAKFAINFSLAPLAFVCTLDSSLNEKKFKSKLGNFATPHITPPPPDPPLSPLN